LPLISTFEPPTGVGGKAIVDNLATMVVVTTGMVDVVVTTTFSMPLLATVGAAVVFEEFLFETRVVTVEIWLCPTAGVVVATLEGVETVPVDAAIVVVTPDAATVVVGDVVVVVTTAEATVVVVDDGVGATGEVIVTEVAASFDAGPVFEAASTTDPALRRATIVPSDAQVTLTVTDGLATAAPGVNTHPVAVPVDEKSLATIPDTASENVNV